MYANKLCKLSDRNGTKRFRPDRGLSNTFIKTIYLITKSSKNFFKIWTSLEKRFMGNTHARPPFFHIVSFTEEYFQHLMQKVHCNIKKLHILNWPTQNYKDKDSTKKIKTNKLFIEVRLNHCLRCLTRIYLPNFEPTILKK